MVCGMRSTAPLRPGVNPARVSLPVAFSHPPRLAAPAALRGRGLIMRLALRVVSGADTLQTPPRARHPAVQS